ncbi:GDP-L-fucose synthase [Halosquirtibacter laminarini]|uniref:GDP-L-fucose synthase n=1 Tax=Halosquirtibacter laminarini TaxID=3374600 RepID=A0AC61ND17_9BACT|nr:GDP-L-fucose synthase [Prolixibacteraceae bacterium]
MNKDSKIYVAGHNGLVGSAICQSLKKQGYTNLISRSHSELDLIDQCAVDEFFQKEKPEYVFLAAAVVGGIVANATYRADFIYGNMMIQNNVIHSSYLHGVKKLLFLGSTCIYPKFAPQPMVESALLTSELEYTNEPYAIAKIAGIKMCESYNLQYGTNFISVMPTNLYGPNDNFDLEKSHVLPALVRKIHLGRCLDEENWDAIREDLLRNPIEGVDHTSDENCINTILDKYGVRKGGNGKTEVEIWGSGTPLREFLWSEEMADACVYVMKHVDFKDVAKDSPVLNTHINIGTGKEIRIKDLANLIKNIVGFDGDLFFNTAKPDGTIRKLTDTSKLDRLGWSYKIGIQEGVEKIYHWYSQMQ